MEPLNSGHYPAEMVKYVRKRLPIFSEEQSSMVKGSYDFIGLNYYTSNYATNGSCESENPIYSTEFCLQFSGEFQLTAISLF